MPSSLMIVAALRDLVPWIPILVIIAALSAFGIVFRLPRSGRPWDSDDVDF